MSLLLSPLLSGLQPNLLPFSQQQNHLLLPQAGPGLASQVNSGPFPLTCVPALFSVSCRNLLGSPTSLCLRALALTEGNRQEELNFTHRDFKPLPGPHLTQSLWGAKARRPDFQKRPPPPDPAQNLALLPFLWCSDIYPGMPSPHQPGLGARKPTSQMFQDCNAQEKVFGTRVIGQQGKYLTCM